MDTRFAASLSMSVRCVKCRVRRNELLGGARFIASGERTIVLSLPRPCRCGEYRVQVRPQAQ